MSCVILFLRKDLVPFTMKRMDAYDQKERKTMPERYEKEFAAAYVRGYAKRKAPGLLPGPLLDTPLAELTDEGTAAVIQAGSSAGLRMYHFKKKEPLPRVKAVIGMLKGFQPEDLLDVGSGRGVFLLPFLKEFPWVPVTSVDLLPHRVEMLQCLAEGGMENLTALRQDICAWDMDADAFDVVTMLEVLEHIPDVGGAVSAAVRLARRYVVASVPSKPDDNPEHIHLLTKDKLTELFAKAGCGRLQFSGVNGHLIMAANTAR